MPGSQVASSLPDPLDEDEFDEGQLDDTELDDGAAAETERLAQVEAEARRQGWRPQAEFRGNPADWVDAETFVQRGRDYLPFVRKELEKANTRNQALEHQLSTVKTQLEEQAEVLNEVRQMARTANEAAYQRAINDMKRAQRQAAAEGDMNRFDELQEQIDEAAGARTAAPKPPPDPPPAPNPRPEPQISIPPEVQAFVDDNPWMMKDRVLYQAMQAEHVAILESAPGLSLTENLERAKEAVMARFPQKFGQKPPEPNNPPPRRPARPQRSTVIPPTPPGGRDSSSLRIDSIQDPVERDQVRKAFEKFSRQMPDYTEEEHMKLYLDPKADVLAMNRERRVREQRRK